MIDMAYSYDHWLLPNGDVEIAGTTGTEGSRGTVPAFQAPKPHPDARRVNLHSGHVFCNREVTEAGKARIMEAWRAMEPSERFELYAKVRPDAGQYGWPCSFRTDNGELSELSEDQRSHFVWVVGRDMPL